MTGAKILAKLQELPRSMEVVRCSRCRHALAVLPANARAFTDRSGEVQSWELQRLEDMATKPVQAPARVQATAARRPRRVHGRDPARVQGSPRPRRPLYTLREIVNTHWGNPKCAALRSIVTERVPVLEVAP